MWQLAPELLKLTRRPFRPALADATFLSWPLLSAACALRLLAYIEPEPPTSTGVVSSGAAFDLAGCGIAPSLVREAAEELFSYEDPFEALRAYAKLDAPTKLALLTIMVDAACDTDLSQKAVDSVDKRRQQMEDTFEREERESRRQARQEREEVRQAVRVRLVQQQQQLAAANGGEDEGVSEGMVVHELNRLTEASAILNLIHGVPVVREGGGGPRLDPLASLLVLSREELTAAEAEISMAAELASSGYDGDGKELSQSACVSPPHTHAHTHTTHARTHARTQRATPPASPVPLTSARVHGRAAPQTGRVQPSS